MENLPALAEEDAKDNDKGSEQDRQGRGAAPEANQLHGKELSREHIGRVLISGEEAPAKVQLNAAEKTVINKRVETMSRTELLEISAKIPAENTNLRSIYETHLISERALRRLVREYLRGGEVEKLLKMELLEHEMDFERDPNLRDRGRPEKTPLDKAANTSLDDLLKQAGVADTSEKGQLAVLKAREAYRRELRIQQIRHRRFMDIAFISVILVLLVLVILLVISRG